MSEFSESFHLKSDRLEEGVVLLEKVSLKGYVLPPHNNWVSYLIASIRSVLDNIGNAFSRSKMSQVVGYWNEGDYFSGVSGSGNSCHTWHNHLCYL